MDEKRNNPNIRTYTVIIDTDIEIPGVESIAVRFEATSRTEAENMGWRWAKENNITVQDIEVLLK